MGIIDDTKRRLRENAEAQKTTSRGQKEDQEALGRRTQTQYSKERVSLEILKEELQPFYSEMRKSPLTLFLVPNVLPLRIKQKNKHSKPELFCNYGLQKKRPHNNKAKNVRTKITVASGTDNYEIEEQALVHLGSGPMGSGGKEKTEWIKDGAPVTKGKNPHIADLDGAVEYMENRIKIAIGDHIELKPKRTAYGLGAVALAAFLGLSQCADANETQHSDDQQDEIGLLDNYDHEP